MGAKNSDSYSSQLNRMSLSFIIHPEPMEEDAEDDDGTPDPAPDRTYCRQQGCYKPPRSRYHYYCEVHSEDRSRRCRAEGCAKHAKTGGYCVSHGGGVRCRISCCTSSAKKGGLCALHGGGKRCKRHGCTKSALTSGLCGAHGGIRRCSVEGCQKGALKGGKCIAHGGGQRCQFEDCSRSAVGGTYCTRHGGGKRCTHPGCNKGAVRNLLCIRHGGRPSRGSQDSSRAEVKRDLESDETSEPAIEQAQHVDLHQS